MAPLLYFHQPYGIITMHKELKFGSEAREHLVAGVQTLAKAVSSTLGPAGRHAIIETNDGSIPVVTKDGVSVARAVVPLENKFENMGASMILEAANRACDAAGDGTTTTTILTNKLVELGIKSINAGRNPVEVKRGMTEAAKIICDELDAMAARCDSEDRIRQVATISANNDSELGDLIAEAIIGVGTHGIVTVEDGQDFQDQLIFSEGMNLDRGYASPHFENTADGTTADMNKPYVLLWGDRINSVRDMKDLLGPIMNEEKDVVIICDDIAPEALNILITNKMSGALKVLVCKAPGIGNDRRGRMEDLAVMLGTKVYSPELGDSLTDIRKEHLGRAQRITSNPSDTTIIKSEALNNAEAIAERVAYLESVIESSEHAVDEQALRKRISKISGGVAIIKVGATSEMEMKEKKDRIDDALSATRCAIDGGVVAGGGNALLSIASSYDGPEVNGSASFLDGIENMYMSLGEPCQAILENAGYHNTELYDMLLKLEAADIYEGFNVVTEEFGNMIDMGVIDPVKVTQSAVRYSASVAGMILTSQVAIGIELPEGRSKSSFLNF